MASFRVDRTPATPDEDLEEVRACLMTTFRITSMSTEFKSL